MKPMIRVSLILLILPLFGFSSAQREHIAMSINPTNWQEREFKGSTNYSLVSEDGELVLHASAAGSASALYREIYIDLNETPYLHWSWRVGTADPAISGRTDERSRSGDDFPARIYVVRRGGFPFWKTRAICYVWSRSQARDSRWRNPFAGRSQIMWAVDSNKTGQWIKHSRDIRADWRLAFQEDIRSLDGIVLMTDADSSDTTANAWYKNIYFSYGQLY